MKKLGARILSESECKLILPTYEQIKVQIENFRKEVKIKTKDSLEQEQKTNNISILGCRGAGKTSLLKTIRNEIIESKNDNDEKKRTDVILPIVIPENMSKSSTMMATILGMFSPIVEKRHMDYLKKQKCDNYFCNKDFALLKKYNEVVKQYTYIQKYYREILLK